MGLGSMFDVRVLSPKFKSHEGDRKLDHSTKALSHWITNGKDLIVAMRERLLRLIERFLVCNGPLEMRAWRQRIMPLLNRDRNPRATVKPSIDAIVTEYSRRDDPDD
jgi:hypothetical protein